MAYSLSFLSRKLWQMVSKALLRSISRSINHWYYGNSFFIIQSCPPILRNLKWGWTGRLLKKKKIGYLITSVERSSHIIDCTWPFQKSVICKVKWIICLVRLSVRNDVTFLPLINPIDPYHSMSKQKILPVEPLIQCEAGRAKTMQRQSLYSPRTPKWPPSDKGE